MLTPDERLMIGLKTLERLKPGLRLQRAEAELRRGVYPPVEETLDALEETQVDGEPCSEGEETFDVPPSRGAPVTSGASFSIHDLLAGIGPLPPASVVLGLCDDGLPFTLDLNNPAPGSLLVTAAAGAGKTRLLRAVLNSAALVNTPGLVSFSLIARDPAPYDDLAELPHCQAALSAANPEAINLVERLAALVEQRRRGAIRGPAVLLAIDDLDSFLQSADEAAFSNLLTLVRHGPRCRVWVLAAVASQAVYEIDERLLAAFRTLLFGSQDGEDEAAAYLAGDFRPDTAELQSGVQFAAPFGSEWVPFWVCDLN